MSRPTAARHRRTPWKRRIAAGSLLAAMAGAGAGLAALDTPAHPPDHPVSTDLGPVPQPIGNGGTVSWPGSPTHTSRPTAVLPVLLSRSPVLASLSPSVSGRVSVSAPVPSSTLVHSMTTEASPVSAPVSTVPVLMRSTTPHSPSGSPTTPPAPSASSAPASSARTTAAPTAGPSPSLLCIPVLHICVPLSGYSHRAR